MHRLFRDATFAVAKQRQSSKLESLAIPRSDSDIRPGWQAGKAANGRSFGGNILTGHK